MAKAAARLLPGLAASAGAGREWIEATCAAVLAHPAVVTLASPLSAEVPPGLRRRDGLPSHERHGASRHTTRETLAREGRVLDALVRGRDAGVAVAADREVERAIGTHGLGADQADALRRICEGGERLTCVVGPAGAGKTRMVLAVGDEEAAHDVAPGGLLRPAVRHLGRELPNAIGVEAALAILPGFAVEQLVDHLVRGPVHKLGEALEDGEPGVPLGRRQVVE